MENLKTLETPDGGVVISKLGQAENQCDKILEEATGLSSLSEYCSGSLLAPEVLVGANGGGFSLAVNRNEEVVVEKTGVEGGMKEGNPLQLSEADPARKIEVSGNEISLFVEVHGEADLGEKHVLRGRSSDRENANGETPIAEVSEIHDFMLGVMQNGTIVGESSAGNEAQEEGVCNQECEFSVGTLVWVKTESQSWWPGLIFDPSNEPKDVVKPDPRACHLVKYFGNGSFVWCLPSELKPLVEHFEQMSAQSNSRCFLGAVEKAVDEFGRCVKMKMTCSCILKENQTIFAANAGTKEGTLMPEVKTCELGEKFMTQFEPENFLAFLKYLARDVSMPGMLEFVSTLNNLTAFHRAIGHQQLPIHQLLGTTDVADGAKGGLKKSGVSMDNVLEKKDEDLAKVSGAERDNVLDRCGSDFAEEGISLSSRKREINKDSEVRNGSVEAADIDICKLASTPAVELNKLSMSPITTENKVSTTENDGGSEGKFEKGYESRERRRSKYLSPPYINVSRGRKNSPISEQNETEDCKGVSHVGLGNNSISGESMGSLPVKGSGKKLRKKWSRKRNFKHSASGIQGGINESSAEMLSELHFAALDCLYPIESRCFDSVEEFFSGFRRLVFHDESNHEMRLLQITTRGEVPMDKGKGVIEVSTEPWGAKTFVGTSDMNKNADYQGALWEDLQERIHPLPKVTSKRTRRKKKEVASVGSNTKPTPGISVINGNPTNGSFTMNFQEMGCLAPDGVSVPKKRKKKAVRNPELLQAKEAVPLPDLNGNCIAPSSAVEDSQATSPITPQDKPEPKKRKRKEGASLLRSRTKSISGLADVNRKNTKLVSFLKDVQVMGPCSTKDMAELNTREGLKGAASLCLNGELSQPETDGYNAERSSFVKVPWQMGLLSPGCKPEPKKRKRKEKAPLDQLKAKVTSAIPDLNGNAAESSLLAKNSPAMNGTIPAKGKPQRKRRQRNKPVAGEVLGTALLLKFAQGFPVPSKEALAATFCGFGPLKESKTVTLNDSSSAQVVFINSSDAGDALQSLEKSSPFGPALVNYRLHRLQASSRALESDTNLHRPVAFRTMDGFNIPAKPYGLKPHPGEAPDLSYIKKNLEMMTSMLEKAGDNLSPETRAKLETDVKGLLKKVRTMVGSSSSS